MALFFICRKSSSAFVGGRDHLGQISSKVASSSVTHEDMESFQLPQLLVFVFISIKCPMTAHRGGKACKVLFYMESYSKRGLNMTQNLWF